MVAEWMARAQGLELPVKHTVRWGWVPGQGPVLVRMEIESVPNVVPLRKARRVMLSDEDKQEIRALFVEAVAGL